MKSDGYDYVSNSPPIITPQRRTCSAPKDLVLCYMESSEERSSWGLPSEFSVSPSEIACMGAENSLLRML